MLDLKINTKVETNHSQKYAMRMEKSRATAAPIVKLSKSLIYFYTLLVFDKLVTKLQSLSVLESH